MENENMTDLENDEYVYPGKRFARNGYIIGEGQGMTLRDYFAGQVLSGNIRATAPIEGVAVEAYKYADAMLEARNTTHAHNITLNDAATLLQCLTTEKHFDGSGPLASKLRSILGAS